jgi:hypothetical protein
VLKPAESVFEDEHNLREENIVKENHIILMKLMDIIEITIYIEESLIREQETRLINN